MQRVSETKGPLHGRAITGFLALGTIELLLRRNPLRVPREIDRRRKKRR